MPPIKKAKKSEPLPPPPEPVVIVDTRPLRGEWRERYERGLRADGAVIVAPATDPREILPGQVRDVPLPKKVILETREEFTATPEENKKTAEEAADPSLGKARRVKVHGLSASSVLRWMGANGFNYDQAIKALASNGVEVHMTTIKFYVNAGSGEGRACGKIPELDKDAAKQLKSAAGIK